MQTNPNSPSRTAKSMGMLAFDLVVAVIGTAILESWTPRILPPRSVQAVTLKEWFIGISWSALLGFLMYRTWRSPTAVWVWVVAGVWFGFGIVVQLGRPESIVIPNHTHWAQLSGAACAGRADKSDCVDFFLFTVPFMRAVSYSVGAFISSRLFKRELRASSGHRP
jgi:hypothetical protein